MAGFCINKELAARLKAAAQKGEINIRELYNMTSAERSAVFEKYADKTTARNINAGFENALVSKQQDALKKWAEDTFTGKEKKGRQYTDIINKIDQLNELGVIHPANTESYMEDLVATRMGVGITQAEIAEIHQRAQRLQEIADKGETTEFGLPSLEYFKARAEMQKYLSSLTPNSRLKVLTSTIGRGTMLFSLKSPITNIVGNSVQGIFTAVEKRLANKQVGGLNNELVRSYVKEANTIYQASGYDVIRMFSIGETFNTLGEDVTSAQGEGFIYKAGRFYEDVVFKQLMGLPDVLFAAAQFGDTANLASTKIAYDEGLSGQSAKARAKEIFMDAARIEPETDIGKMVRAQAIADAQYATFTNDSKYSEVALGIRKMFNNATGDLRLGDLLMPFVKTPANVVGAGLDAMGVSAIRGAFDLPNAISEFKKGNKAPMQQVFRNFVRSGMGLTIAFILAASFDPDEFVGAYPTSQKEKELLNLQNGTANSIKIGDKWVSLDYFGPFAPTMIGLLYAKKYGNDAPSQILKYIQGGAEQAAKMPGIDTLSQLVASIQDFAPGEGSTVQENIMGVVNGVADQAAARLIPAIISDFAKVIDPNEREVDYKDPIAKLKSKIPILRNQLPAKKDVFGNEKKTEPAISTLLFGSRVKSAKESAVIDELTRLNKAGQLPSITNVEKTSSRVGDFKSQVSADRYEESMKWYRDNLAKEYQQAMESGKYKRASNEEKKNILDNLKNDILDKALKRGGYRKPNKN